MENYFTHNDTSNQPPDKRLSTQNALMLEEYFPGGVVRVGLDGSILGGNPEGIKLLGYTLDTISQKYVADWGVQTINEDGSEFPVEKYPVTLTLKTGKPQGPVCIGIKNPDGQIVWAIFCSLPVYAAPDKQMSSVSVFIVNVTSEMNALLLSRKQEHNLQKLLENIPHYITNFTPKGEIVYLNHFAEGLDYEDVLGSSIYDYHLEEDHAKVRAIITRVVETGQSESFETSVKVGGSSMHLSIVYWSFVQDGRILIGTIGTDVTNLMQLNKNLWYQANHDPLTGLMNRYRFEEIVTKAIEKARNDRARHVLLYIDLDQFKIVNDTHGHMAGDALLRNLSQVLIMHLADDICIARLGGDEFGILIEDVDLEQGSLQARQILAIISDFRFPWEGQLFRIGASIGLTGIDHGCESYNQLLKDADIACYIAKDAGRNQLHVFEPDDDRANLRKKDMSIVGSIHKALENRQFELYFQYIFALNRNERKAGIEILLRMHSESNEILTPGVFMDTAERYDMSRKIDRWVVRNVLNWMRDNLPIIDELEFITINLSGKSLGNEHFQNYCRYLFSEYSLPFEKICFEITETAAISDMLRTRKFMYEIGQFGIKFALDDFGSGLSSFTYLRDLPIDLLKIDGSFIRKISEDNISYLMVKSMHELAAAMEIRTVGEFVENVFIQNSLIKIGVDFGQGYHLHKPEALKNLNNLVFA